MSVCFFYQLLSFKPETENNARIFLLEIVGGFEKSRLMRGGSEKSRVRAGFNAEDARSDVFWFSHTLGVALATGQLRR